jgi:hypothetical protein
VADRDEEDKCQLVDMCLRDPLLPGSPTNPQLCWLSYESAALLALLRASRFLVSYDQNHPLALVLFAFAGFVPNTSSGSGADTPPGTGVKPVVLSQDTHRFFYLLMCMEALEFDVGLSWPMSYINLFPSEKANAKYLSSIRSYLSGAVFGVDRQMR